MKHNMKPVWLYLENGLFFEARSFGAEGTAVGEIVFNTSMTGYQEIITDPSYAGQFVTFTMPEIGNVGCNREDMESSGAWCKGIIVRQYQNEPSNFRSEEPLHELLRRYGIIGICETDTRFLTKVLREEGAMMMIASTETSDKTQLAKLLFDAPHISEINYIEAVSTKERYVHKTGAYDAVHYRYKEAPKPKAKVVAIDFGIKRNILNELSQAGMQVEVVPNSIDADELIDRYKSKEIDGVFLSNGPGDPLILVNEQRMIAKLMDAKVPMFGICLGHQLLSIASGFKTYKLKFGHHGGNHPVKNFSSGAVEITAQNHNYNVPEEIREIAEVTHINLFDNTIEGLRYKNVPVISVQHHPEASPGPHESRYIFSEFLKMVER